MVGQVGAELAVGQVPHLQRPDRFRDWPAQLAVILLRRAAAVLRRDAGSGVMGAKQPTPGWGGTPGWADNTRVRVRATAVNAVQRCQELPVPKERLAPVPHRSPYILRRPVLKQPCPMPDRPGTLPAMPLMPSPAQRCWLGAPEPTTLTAPSCSHVHRLPIRGMARGGGHLDQLVPAGRDDGGHGCDGGEAHAGHPLRVAVRLGDGVLAVPQRVPQLDGLVPGSGHDLQGGQVSAGAGG